MMKLDSPFLFLMLLFEYSDNLINCKIIEMYSIICYICSVPRARICILYMCVQCVWPQFSHLCNYTHINKRNKRVAWGNVYIHVYLIETENKQFIVKEFQDQSWNYAKIQWKRLKDRVCFCVLSLCSRNFLNYRCMIIFLSTQLLCTIRFFKYK